MARQRTQEEIQQFNEEVRLRRLDDLDHDDRTRASNTSAGAHSASHKFSDAIPIFEKIIREEADPNGDNISALERMRMFNEEPMMRAAGANLNYDLVEKTVHRGCASVQESKKGSPQGPRIGRQCSQAPCTQFGVSKIGHLNGRLS